MKVFLVKLPGEAAVLYQVNSLCEWQCEIYLIIGWLALWDSWPASPGEQLALRSKGRGTTAERVV